jgi:DNA-binding MarR family transcriptional regulator
MAENQADKLVEDIMEDSILYIKLFNNELVHLGDRVFMKTLSWLLLIESYDNPSISELGKISRLAKSQMTSKIDQLVNDGLIMRIPDEKDRRILRVELTPYGYSFIKTSRNLVEENMKQLLSSLSFEEVEELKKSIETIKNIFLKIQDANKE